MQYGAEAIIVRIPQLLIEPASLGIRAHSQVDTLRGAGYPVGAYWWLYRDVPVQQQVKDAMDFMNFIDLNPKFTYPDFETYQNTIPTLVQIKEACQRQEDSGRPAGVYTSEYMWSLIGSPVDPYLSSLPLWTANYNWQQDLNVPMYGGWTACVGHQYLGGVQDQNVFDRNYVI